MEQFKNNPEKFKEPRKAILFKTLPLSLIAGAGGIAISTFNSNPQQTDITSWLFVIPLILGSMSFGLYLSLKKQKELFESYVLTIDDMSITRTQNNTPTIRIPKSEISEIIKNSNGSFSVKGNSLLNMIGIPAQINNYERLEHIISEIKELSIKTSEPFLQKFQWRISILTIGLMAAVYISGNKLTVGTSGTILLIILGYSFFVLQKSKNIDRNTKKTAWIVLLVTTSIIGVMYYKLTA
jgi:hypothetical protein